MKEQDIKFRDITCNQLRVVNPDANGTLLLDMDGGGCVIVYGNRPLVNIAINENGGNVRIHDKDREPYVAMGISERDGAVGVIGKDGESMTTMGIKVMITIMPSDGHNGVCTDTPPDKPFTEVEGPLKNVTPDQPQPRRRNVALNTVDERIHEAVRMVIDNEVPSIAEAFRRTDVTYNQYNLKKFHRFKKDAQKAQISQLSQ